MNKISIIIPIGKAFNGLTVLERKEAVLFSIEHFYKKHNDVEVIIVSQNYDFPNIDGVKIIKINSPIFNKGWCINVGVRAANNSIICIAESDMYSMQPHLNDTADFMMKKGLKWCFAWDSLVFTTSEQRTQIMGGSECTGDLDIKKPIPNGCEGGFLMFERQFFLNLGGCNEWLEELGCIDNELTFRSKFSTNTYEMYPFTVYHLWHPLCKKHTRTKNLDINMATKFNTDRFNVFLSEQNFGNKEHPLCSVISFEEAWDGFKKDTEFCAKKMFQKAWMEYHRLKNKESYRI